MNVLWLSNIRKADVEANDENVIWIYYDDTNNERKNIAWMREHPNCHVIFYRDNQSKDGYWQDENLIIQQNSVRYAVHSPYAQRSIRVDDNDVQDNGCGCNNGSGKETTLHSPMRQIGQSVSSSG